MKLSIIALAMTLATPAFAADKPPAAPIAPPPPSIPVQLTMADLQFAITALVNAGASCDNGTKIYCVIMSNRDATVQKLQKAFQDLSAEIAFTPAPAKK